MTPSAQQAVQNRPRRAARAEHHHRSAALAPARRLFVEIGDEPIGVGIAGAKPPRLIEPQRVGGADRARRFVGHRGKPERGFLVRQRDIGSGKALGAERAEKPRQRLGPHRFFFIGAVDAVLLQPIAMDQG